MRPQEGHSASEVALAQGHATLAQLLLSQTSRPQTGRNLSHAQVLETPSAPPWTPQASHQATPHNPALPHARSLRQQGSSPQLVSSGSARLDSSATRTNAVTYPAVFASSASPSEQPSAEATVETGGATRSRAARPGPSAAQHQAPQEGVRRFGSDSLQAEAVQAEAPRMGFVPAAVSFMMGRLQVR